MSHSIEEQMLNALEVFHYSYRFRNHLFVLALEDQVRLRDLITDFRVFLSSRIQILVLCRDHGGLEQHLATWGDRGYPFHYISIDQEKEFPGEKYDYFDAAFREGKIPVLGLSETMEVEQFDDLALNLAESMAADKLFFVSTVQGLIADGRFYSHLTTKEVTDILENAKDINIGAKRLLTLSERNSVSDFETVLIEGVGGELFQEIFTHRGKGTLLTNDYPNEVRRGQISDVMDLLLIMKPYIQSKLILPISEDELSETIDSYVVYQVNRSIVASARIIDYGIAAELGKFCTMPRYQGRGRARELAISMIESMKKAKKQYLFALSIEPRMWDFFKSLDFQECDREALPDSWKEKYDFSRASKAFRYNL